MVVSSFKWGCEDFLDQANMVINELKVMVEEQLSVRARGEPYLLREVQMLKKKVEEPTL